MAFVGSHVSVGTTATAIVTAGASDLEAWIKVSNGTVYLGGSSVTNSGANSGLPVASTEQRLHVRVRPGDTLYGASDSGGPYTVYILTRSAA